MNATTGTFQFGENRVPQIPRGQKQDKSTLAYFRPYQLDIINDLKNGVKMSQIARNIWNEPSLASCTRYSSFPAFYQTVRLVIITNRQFFCIPGIYYPFN